MLSPRIRAVVLLCASLIILHGCSKKEGKSPEANLEELPMKEIDLSNFDAFKAPGKNWSIAGGVFADYKKDQAIEATAGKGVLVNIPDESNKDHLFTTFEHGDMDLELDFLLPKGSNSGLYFQGRYEVQLFDSWNKEIAESSDCGGIYERWDETKPEGSRGYEGHAPSVNACKAPGLWQHMKVSYRAPRFDSQGNKIENAKFTNVYLNGYLIQEDVEVTGPTRAAFFSDEKPTGPLMIQGDHGPVAFRNVRYKSYTLDSLTLGDIKYDFYDNDSTLDHLPDFSKLTPDKSGTATNLNVTEASDKNEFFSLLYTAELNVPISGDYLFTTVADEGDELIIDRKSVLRKDDTPGGGTATGLVNLTQGKHNVEIKFYQNNWSAVLLVFYEGPGISHKALAAPPNSGISRNRSQEPMIIEASQSPEMLRSFILYKDTVKTHVISIGEPEKVNYTYDLTQGALVKTWKGVFADVSDMWRGRGELQQLQPANFAIDLTDGLPIAQLATDSEPWPVLVSPDFTFKKYTIGNDGNPVFHYNYKSVTVQNEFHPSADSTGLEAAVSISSEAPVQNLYYRIASADKIDELPDGLYNVDGDYYVKILKADGAKVRSGKELVVPVLNDNKASIIQYTIIW
jgi:3-keto-disaccharide hydrolase/PA14 domain